VSCPQYYFYSSYPTGFKGWQRSKRPHAFWSCCGDTNAGNPVCAAPAELRGNRGAGHGSADTAALAAGKEDQDDAVAARLLRALKDLTPASIEKLCKEAEGLRAKQRFMASPPPVVCGGKRSGAARSGHTSNVHDRMISASSADNSGSPALAWGTHTATVDGEAQAYDSHVRRLINRVNQRRSLTSGMLSMWEEQWTNETESRDPAGERAVKQLGRVLHSKGLEFSDPDFPPTDASLFREPNTKQGGAGARATFRKDKDPFLAGVERVEWRRADEIGDINKRVVVFQS
jgi:hypothetical protein